MPSHVTFIHITQRLDATFFINQELLTIVRGLLLLRAFFFSPVIYNTLVFHDMVCVCVYKPSYQHHMII